MEAVKVEMLNSPKNKMKMKPVNQNKADKIRFFLFEKPSKKRTKNPVPKINKNAGIIRVFV